MLRPRPLHVLACLALGATSTVVALSPARADGQEAAAANAATALASLPAPDWRKYVQGTSHAEVSPVRIVSSTGDVTNPEGLLGEGTTTLHREAPKPKPAWPSGTSATASSYHAPNGGNDGTPTSYEPGHAVDGDAKTFWNDANPDTYPAWLQITSPAPVKLPGITVLSNSDGVPMDFTVATWNGSAWVTQATVTGNTDVQRAVAFPQEVTTDQVRITVTKDQPSSRGDFTRINEVWPGVVSDPAQASVTLDFGKVVVGYPTLRFKGASDDHPGVRLAFSETLQYLTDRSDFTRSDFSGGPGTDQYAPPEKSTTWTDAKGCQSGTKVCADGLHGFRYMRISLDALPSDAPVAEPYGTVKLKDVTLQSTALSGGPGAYRGWFESSDDALNRYWYNASYTNELITDTFRPTDVEPRNADSPSLDGKLVLQDGAKRDRDPYVGDVAVSGRTDYLTHAVPEAARNVLADLADHQRADGWIPPASINDYTLPLFDYPLWWVTSSSDYVLYSGDTAYAAKYYPNLVKTLDTWYPSVTDARGLLSKGLNGTGGYGDYAFLPRTGEVTYYNALYVQALKDAAGLARSLGHVADADRWQQRAQDVAKAINTYLWDARTGAYLDSGTGAVRHGQDGNGLAIVAGVASPDQAAAALGHLAKATAQPYGNAFMDNDTLVSDGSKRVYAFTSYPEIQARFQSGQADSAIEEIKRLYGWMTAHDPGITDWEGIGENGSLYEGAYTSMAHGWSTGVVPALSNDLLGAVPTGPGFATWTVAPNPGSVQWARGVLPTPHGDLRVTWTQGHRAILTLAVDAPTGTSGDIAVPTGGRQVVVRVDGEVAWDGTAALAHRATTDGAHVTLHGFGAGHHTIQVTGR
ncbi:alpha-L-rhamnosidase-related protein [Actinoallomurus rhizosphaericola]|uniref:alpha-L-rhamnosidase-related protein n=1 Tax=Actinoallomurus rhizosphaericola TaxID=2952536 RepID=UPI00209323B0|nr:alpha-L-rhamnosidase C-terminal domain-containing protein [Actinoallomurus rhizosphaericola]MCO5997279.1 discoidin domain-containing protein [Actinoallomurus rhizosphaericola]